MNPASPFSYRCGQCGLCCHNKVITLSPYDVTRMSRAAGLRAAETIARFTLRRGSLLLFDADGACTALRGSRCTIHKGRPLACRLYPLGIERGPESDRFVRLEAAPGSAGICGEGTTVSGFLEQQGAGPYLDATRRYEELLNVLKTRVAELADFERIEPREFRRRAVREALAESSYDSNELIDALFDFEEAGANSSDEQQAIEEHLAALTEMASRERDAAKVASAAVLLAVSLGRGPEQAFSSIP